MLTPGGLILVALAALAGPGAAPAPSLAPAERRPMALDLRPCVPDFQFDRCLLAAAPGSIAPTIAAAEWHAAAPPGFRLPDPALLAFLLAGLAIKSRDRLRAATARPPAE